MFNKKQVITHFQIQNFSYKLKRGYIDNIEIVDVRPEEIFNLKDETEGSLRMGNIPMSKNLFFDSVLKDDFSLKSEKELEETFKVNNIDIDKFVMTTCGSGVTACILIVALRIIGRTNNAVYDGSWTEYGTLPEYKDAEIEKRISEPLSRKLIPSLEKLEEGKNYNWCACGRAKDLVFCDGSHRSTNFVPKRFKVESNQKKLLCRCKNTKTPPYCDFTHVKVMVNSATKMNLFSGVTCNKE